jgi:hypothetical protein
MHRPSPPLMILLLLACAEPPEVVPQAPQGAPSTPAPAATPHVGPCQLQARFGAAATAPARAAVPASRVESAAWRLDEALPRRTGTANPTDPARQRGVTVGTVAKLRRTGAPPLLVATGTREGHAALVVLDAAGDTTLDTMDLSPAHDWLHALPAFDIDGDGGLEIVAYSPGSVHIVGLDPTSGALSPELTWACPEVHPDKQAPN